MKLLLSPLFVKADHYNFVRKLFIFLCGIQSWYLFDYSWLTVILTIICDTSASQIIISRKIISLWSLFILFPPVCQVWNIQSYNCVWSSGGDSLYTKFWKLNLLSLLIHKSKHTKESSVIICFLYVYLSDTWCWHIQGSCCAIFHWSRFVREHNNRLLLGKHLSQYKMHEDSSCFLFWQVKQPGVKSMHEDYFSPLFVFSKKYEIGDR